MLFDCGKDHTLVVINGELYACGNNKYGQLGFNVSFDVKTFTKVPYSFDESGIKSVKCGDGFSLVLTNSGNLYACGYNDFKDHIHRLKYYDETSSEDYDYYYEWNYNNGSYNDYEEHYCDDICLHTFVQLSNLNDISLDNLNDKNEIILKPGCKIIIPSGIKVNFNDGNPRVLIAFNKSGIASKLGLDVLACVIDQDYQGEIHVNFTNTTKKIVKIKPNEKIIQCIMLPVFYESIEEVPIEKLYSEVTIRGEGGFGSTGTH